MEIVLFFFLSYKFIGVFGSILVIFDFFLVEGNIKDLVVWRRIKLYLYLEGCI